MRILISAGEASGETYGALLIESLRRRVSDLECFGVGGERMRAAGCDLVVQARAIAVVGLTEVVSHLPRIYREFRRLLREVDRRRPEVAVLIDFPDWNFRLARELHARGIPVVYYVSPQLWAWRPGRIELVKRYVRKMLVIFPFEEAWYRERGVKAEYVGHPLADLPKPKGPFGVLRVQARKPAEPLAPLSPLDHVIALLPGSRRKEVEMNLPAMLSAGDALPGNNGFVIPVASTVPDRTIDGLVKGSKLWLNTNKDARGALAQARAAIVASGTATLEAALIGTPFVMVYRVSPLSWLLGRRLVNVPFFAMPNLIAGREVVPELVQADFTAANVAARMREILPDGPARTRMLEGFAEIRQKLTVSGPGTASDRAADAVLKVLGDLWGFSPAN